MCVYVCVRVYMRACAFECACESATHIHSITLSSRTRIHTQVMQQIKTAKAGNANVVLADGSELGGAGAGAPGFQDLSGVLLQTLRCIEDMCLIHVWVRRWM